MSQSTSFPWGPVLGGIALATGAGLYLNAQRQADKAAAEAERRVAEAEKKRLEEQLADARRQPGGQAASGGASSGSSGGRSTGAALAGLAGGLLGFGAAETDLLGAALDFFGI